MRILIVSALFPPDVATPAPYIKELATRLASDYDVSVVTYGNIPEAIAGVEIVTVAKNTALPVRLWHFFTTLRAYAKTVDAVIVNNAPSTELPALFAQLFSSAKWLRLDSDEKLQYHGWQGWLHKLATRRLPNASSTLPLPRPEQHPFHPPSETQWKRYEVSWETHLRELNKQLL